MNIVNILTWTQEFSYISNKNPVKLKREIEKVCASQRGINLAGKFNSDDEFELTPRWQLITIQSFEREVSFVQGKIYTDPLNRTTIDFSVRPNSIFVIFFFLFPAIAIFNFFNSNAQVDFLFTIIFGLVVPLSCLAIGIISRDTLKDRFIQTFELVQPMKH